MIREIVEVHGCALAARAAALAVAILLGAATGLAFGLSAGAGTAFADDAQLAAGAEQAEAGQDAGSAGDSASADEAELEARAAAEAAQVAKEQRQLEANNKAVAPKPYKGKGAFYITAASSSKKVLAMQNNRRVNDVAMAVAKRSDTNLQRFKLEPAGKGLYYIRNVATGRLLSADAPVLAPDGTKPTALMRADAAKKYQRWQVLVNNDKSISFVNAKTKTYLSLSSKSPKIGSKIKLRAYAANATQKFKLKRTARNKNEIVQINVPCTLQNPQLPTGCESVALTNALNYWGFGLWKTTIADRWMPRGSNGVYNFIGNPRDSSGWIICAPGISNTADKYLNTKDTDVCSKIVKGAKLKSLRTYLDQGYPVIVWTTIGMGSPGPVFMYRSGYPLRNNNHAVVLSGYNPKTGNYRVSDSLAGTVWRNGSSFANLYAAMGSQAVVLYN